MTSTLSTYAYQSSNIYIRYLFVWDVIGFTSVDVYEKEKKLGKSERKIDFLLDVMKLMVIDDLLIMVVVIY